MKIDNTAWNALISAFNTANGDSKQAKALFELWLEENYRQEIYKEGWLDACEEYGIKDNFYTDDDDYDAGDLIYDGY